ncbi:HEAT repeat-containing protein 6, partial [Chytriomyces hyalinus]
MCVKTGSKFGTSLHEPVLRVLMQALESQYAQPGSFAASANLAEIHEKMMTSALRGIQILLTENKTIFTLPHAHLVSRLYYFIFSYYNQQRVAFAKEAPLPRSNHARKWTNNNSVNVLNQDSRQFKPKRSSSASSWRSKVGRSSDAEASDSDERREERVSLEKLRLYALNTLQTLSKAFPKLMYSKWTLFMPTLVISAMDNTREHTSENFSAQQSLFDVMLSDARTPRVRIAAILILQSFLEGSLQYLAVAEGGKKETPSQTFTSLSQKLTDTVTDMHTVLLAIIAGKSVEMKIEVERDDSVLAAALRCLAVLIQNSPYTRLTHHDLRADCFQACIEVAEDCDSVRLAQLETLAHLFDAGFIVPDGQAKNLLLNIMRPHWKPAPDSQTLPNPNLWVAA